MVALMAVAMTAAKTINATTSGSRRSAGSKAGIRRRTHAAATASSVFPVAIPAAVHSGASVPVFATNAASQTAGQSERPQRSRTAIAIPVGAHTVVICSATNANRNPSRAATTYATATAKPVTTNRRGAWIGVGGATITSEGSAPLLVARSPLIEALLGPNVMPKTSSMPFFLWDQRGESVVIGSLPTAGTGSGRATLASDPLHFDDGPQEAGTP